MKMVLAILVPFVLSACSLNKQFVLAMDKNVPPGLDERDKFAGDLLKAKGLLATSVGEEKANELWALNELEPLKESDLEVFGLNTRTVKDLIAEAKKKVEEE